MTKRILALTVLLFLAAPLASAATATVTQIKPLTVDIDHGLSITLPTAAASVFIANPEIADVQVMSPTSIMIFGKRTGETTFMATDTAGNTLAERTVLVLQDLSALREEMNAAIPGNKIHVQTLPNGI